MFQLSYLWLVWQVLSYDLEGWRTLLVERAAGLTISAGHISYEPGKLRCLLSLSSLIVAAQSKASADPTTAHDEGLYVQG